MSTTLDEISKFMDAAKLRYGKEDDRIRTGFATDLYEDHEGDNCLHLTIRLEEDGELLRIQAPRAYQLPPKAGARKLAAVQRTINQLNWETKVGLYEMDTEDGEIRLCIDLPLEDAQLTELQLTRLIRLMPMIIDQGHLALRQAIDDGIPVPNEAELAHSFKTFILNRVPGSSR